MGSDHELKIIASGDGSHTLFVESMNETYHSKHGAVTESEHVFIRNGLKYMEALKEVRILEVGFGTGLNAFLTLLDAQKTGQHMEYYAIEAFPLKSEIVNRLNYPKTPEESEIFLELHRKPWEMPVALIPNFVIRKIHSLLENFDPEPRFFDIVYFDAFAPSRQPEIWTIEILSKVVSAIRSNGILVTYCAQGQFKRDLRSLGMTVTSLAGPPGKHEMVRAVRQKEIDL